MVGRTGKGSAEGCTEPETADAAAEEEEEEVAAEGCSCECGCSTVVEAEAEAGAGADALWFSAQCSDVHHPPPPTPPAPPPIASNSLRFEPSQQSAGGQGKQGTHDGAKHSSHSMAADSTPPLSPDRSGVDMDVAVLEPSIEAPPVPDVQPATLQAEAGSEQLPNEGEGNAAAGHPLSPPSHTPNAALVIAGDQMSHASVHGECGPAEALPFAAVL